MTQTYQLVDAKGAGGAAYQFQVYPWGTEFRTLPGLYIFSRPGAQGGWDALYVGQTHDLQNRVGSGLPNHHKYLSAILADATHIGVHPFQGREADRLAAERDLIAGLKPKLNDTAPALGGLAGLGGILGRRG